MPRIAIHFQKSGKQIRKTLKNIKLLKKVYFLGNTLDKIAKDN